MKKATMHKGIKVQEPGALWCDSPRLRAQFRRLQEQSGLDVQELARLAGSSDVELDAFLDGSASLTLQGVQLFAALLGRSLELVLRSPNHGVSGAPASVEPEEPNVSSEQTMVRTDCLVIEDISELSPHEICDEIKTQLGAGVFALAGLVPSLSTRPPGRPKKSGRLDSEEMFIRMAELILLEQVRRPRGAAKQFADNAPGTGSTESKIRRLTTNFKKDERRYLGLARIALVRAGKLPAVLPRRMRVVGRSRPKIDLAKVEEQLAEELLGPSKAEEALTRLVCGPLEHDCVDRALESDLFGTLKVEAGLEQLGSGSPELDRYDRALEEIRELTGESATVRGPSRDLFGSARRGLSKATPVERLAAEIQGSPATDDLLRLIA